MLAEHGPDQGRAAEPAAGQIHALRPLIGGVRRRRGSEPWPGRPSRRPVRARAPRGGWSMLGRRRAGMTGTPSMTTLPQGTWAPWTATIGTTTWGSARTLAARSASNDTARRTAVRG